MSYKEQLLSHNRTQALGLSESALETKVENTIARTFVWMGITLLVSFGIAFAGLQGIINLPFSMPLYWGSFIAGLGVIFFMSWKWQSLSYPVLASLLLLFGVLEGYGLMGMFMSYGMGSIAQVFAMTSGMFFILAIAGYMFDINVARVGPVLMAGLVVLIIALIANYFIGNAIFDIWLSVIGIILFSALIIYDMNVLKQQALVSDSRIELLMALGLFLNFVNIFIFMLRLVGGNE